MTTHLAQDCSCCPAVPIPIEQVRCRGCNTFGHRRYECPQAICSRCEERGHTSYACPEPPVCYKCRQQGHIRSECKTIMGRVYKAALKALAPGEYMPSPAQENTSGQGATADGAGSAVGNQVVAPADAWGAAADGGVVAGGQAVAPIETWGDAAAGIGAATGGRAIDW